MIQYGGEGKSIPLNDIYYMKSRNHNIILYLKDGHMEYYAKIGDLEEELAGRFYRIHQGYLINPFHFYNLHCLGYLMASSIYEKAMSIMMKSIDFLLTAGKPG